jgi:hypothetical protein
MTHNKNNNNGKLTPRRIQLIGSTLVVAVVSLLSVWFYFLYTLVQSHAFRVFPAHYNVGVMGDNGVVLAGVGVGKKSKSVERTPLSRPPRTNRERSICDFRNYPPHRYYQLDQPRKQRPPFLDDGGANVEYIYGEWPTLLRPKSLPTKLCVNQSDWLTTTTTMTTTSTWPFADGTNPSILHMNRIKLKAADVYRQILRHFPSTQWVATVCMTNSQCTWRDEKVDPTVYDLPNNRQQSQPDVSSLVLFATTRKPLCIVMVRQQQAD